MEMENHTTFPNMHPTERAWQEAGELACAAGRSAVGRPARNSTRELPLPPHLFPRAGNTCAFLSGGFRGLTDVWEHSDGRLEQSSECCFVFFFLLSSMFLFLLGLSFQALQVKT